MKTTFHLINKLFSNYKFKTNKREAFLLKASLDLYVNVYPCCLIKIRFDFSDIIAYHCIYIYIYLFLTAGQTSGPNWLTFFEGTYEYSGSDKTYIDGCYMTIKGFHQRCIRPKLSFSVCQSETKHD